MERHAQHLRRLRRQHRGPIAHRRDAIELQAAQRIQRFGDAVELHRDGAIAPGIVHHVAAVGGQREIHAQAPRRIGENADLVAGGGGEKQ